jgi:hypothetical protein
MSRSDKRARHPAVKEDDDMLPHYDFSNGERGKYAARYREGTNSVLLDPDVFEVFVDSRSVNEALRTLIRVTRKARRPRRTRG